MDYKSYRHTVLNLVAFGLLISFSASYAKQNDVITKNPEAQSDRSLTENQKRWFESLGERDSKRETMETECLRREYRNLTSGERRTWYNAVNAMKNNMIDDMSEYDIFVTYHQISQSPAAHTGAAFLPWHREYLFRMERALLEHDPWACLPYWDSSLEVDLPTVSDSAIWTPEYLGDAIGTVISGPFANWTVIPECTAYGELLARAVGQSGKPFNDDDIEYVFDQTEYGDIVCYIDCRFEFDSHLARTFVGGHMDAGPCSPSDPTFWLHHAFVDLIWEEFRQEHQLTNIEEDYPVHGEDGDIGGIEHNPDAPMLPFTTLLNIHGISDHYTNYYYEYAPRFVSCMEEEDCGGDLLWCDVTQGRCRAKVMLWGDCTGFPNEACACTGECIPEDDSHTDDPECINNICVI